ncbi:MAG: NAD(P)-dependent oxidoreductase [Candidatus Moranbacteria bacterium]|nr:NAD(P)-dependent oxidoreductase [Candidatus Moranbacteria bacterium]MDD3964631.1 NAD(P)-dependent oxidoreductase [Candidatus Moranbacteria bacterium]
MKIAFFETSASDQAFLSPLLQGHDVSFFSEPLTKENVTVASEYEVVSVFIYSTLTADIIDQLHNVRCIATRSTGFDHIDLPTCETKDITVLHVPHYGENTVAEHAFALILALSRNVHKSYARGLKEDFSIEGLIGFDLKDKTLGVIGTGRIGLHVIRIAKGFGMHVLAFDVFHNTLLSEILHFSYASLDEVLAQSDIITLHTPYNKHTHHLINNETIKKIKKGALLINTARGGLIENEALIKALDEKILSGAGLDVLEGEEYIKEEGQCLHEDCAPSRAHQIDQNKNLLSRDNVVFTPHIGFYSEEALKRILETTAENIVQYGLGKKENQVHSLSQK